MSLKTYIMDIASVILGIFFLLLFTLPLGWIIYKQYNAKKKFEKIIFQFGNQHHFNFTQIEVNHWSFIGLDRQKKALAIAQKTAPDQIDLIDLNQLNLIQLIGDAEKTSTISEIKLKLSGNFEPKEIIFYKDEEDISADAAIQLNTAKTWLDFIKSA